jgi:predicted dehydrogenase
MENPLRIGVIGAGEMSTWAILPALHFAPLDLRAICDLDADRAEGAATKYGPCLIEFVDAIREQRQPDSGIHDSVETMKLYQAIYDAIRDGQSNIIFEQ